MPVVLLVALVAAALIVVIGWPDLPRRPVDAVNRARADLVRANGNRRIVSGRLVGGFGYGPIVVTRGGQGVGTEPTADVRLAAAMMEHVARDSITPHALAGVGASRLVMGDTAGAIRALEASQRASADAHTATDLAAAYLARFEQTGHYEDLPRALDSLAHARASQPNLVEAAFNEALTLEAAGLHQQARAAWRHYLSRNIADGWTAEARLHLSKLESREESWEDRIAAIDLRPDRCPDAAVVALAVERFAQPAREWLERDVAAAWVESIRRADAPRQAAIVATAHTVASALLRATGDRMALDVAHEWATTRDPAALAAAHDIYLDGLSRNRRHERAAAGERFGQSEEAFRHAGSRLELWAAVQHAVIEYQLRRIESAREQLEHVEVMTRQLPYPILRARISWLRGFVAMQQGRLAQAVPFYRDAAQAYERAGEMENAGHVYNTWADTLRILGEYREGWEVLGHAIARAPSFREPLRRYLVFFNASLYAAREALPFASLRFENGAIEAAALDTESPAAQIEARLRRAALLGRVGRAREAAADLAFAADRLPNIKDAAQAAYFAATQHMVEAELFADRADAVANADAAMRVFERAEPAEIPRLLLARARALRHTGASDDAERALLTAMDVFEQRRRQLPASNDRIAYLDQGLDLYRELADIRLTRGAGFAAAFDAMERGRARTLFEDLAGMSDVALSLPVIQNRLRPRTALVIYSVLPERLLTWVVTRDRSTFHEARLTADDVTQRVEALQTALSLEASPAHVDAAVTSLYGLLVGPWIHDIAAGDTLVVVPDGPLHELPFALLAARGGRQLIDDHAIVVAPSASLFVKAGMRQADVAASRRHPLLVGAPLLDEPQTRQLPHLPEVAGEIADLAALYPQAERLMGREATVSNVQQRLPRASMFHFSGHAAADPFAPQLSRLVLNRDPGSAGIGALYSTAIARLDLRGVQLVVLAACETAAGPVRGEGVVSIARAFLAAGVPTVVATRWAVEDRAARTMFNQFHRAIRDGLPPEEALRRTQLAMRASGDAVLNDPHQWAGLIVIEVAGGASAPE